MTPIRDGRGWATVSDCGAFVDHSGTIFWTRDQLDGEDVRFGFFVEDYHCNMRPMCHGGMLASFLDIALARGIRLVGDLDPPFPTISMSMDFLAPAPLGSWVDARVKVNRIGRTTAFGQATLCVDDAPIMTGSGVYRHFNPR